MVSTERCVLTLNWLSDAQQWESSSKTLELVVSPRIILAIKFIAAFIAIFLRSQWGPRYPGAHWQITFVPSDLHVPPFWQGLLGWHRLAPIWHDNAFSKILWNISLRVKKSCMPLQVPKFKLSWCFGWSFHLVYILLCSFHCYMFCQYLCSQCGWFPFKCCWLVLVSMEPKLDEKLQAF